MKPMRAAIVMGTCDEFACFLFFVFFSLGEDHIIVVVYLRLISVRFTRIDTCLNTISFPLTETNNGVFKWLCSGIRTLNNDY